MKRAQLLYIVSGCVLLSATSATVAWQAHHDKTIYPGDSVTITCTQKNNNTSFMCCDPDALVISPGGECFCED